MSDEDDKRAAYLMACQCWMDELARATERGIDDGLRRETVMHMLIDQAFDLMDRAPGGKTTEARRKNYAAVLEWAQLRHRNYSKVYELD